MNLDKYSRRIIVEKDLVELLYSNPSADLSHAYLDNPSKHNEAIDLNYSELSKIDTLKEYRQSLISEVVTGKIKVTTDE